MALDCSFQKWTAPYLANLSTEDASVLVGIFSSISAEFARYSKLVEEQCASIASHVTTMASQRASITALEVAVAACCAAATTTTTTTTAAPAAATTTTTVAPAAATTTTTAATTTTTAAPGVSCTSCTQTAVSENACMNLGSGSYIYTRSGISYDGTCQPVGCVGCSCPTIIVWGDWFTDGTTC